VQNVIKSRIDAFVIGVAICGEKVCTTLKHFKEERMQ